MLDLRVSGTHRCWISLSEYSRFTQKSSFTEISRGLQCQVGNPDATSFVMFWGKGWGTLVFSVLWHGLYFETGWNALLKVTNQQNSGFNRKICSERILCIINFFHWTIYLGIRALPYTLKTVVSGHCFLSCPSVSRGSWPGGLSQSLYTDLDCFQQCLAEDICNLKSKAALRLVSIGVCSLRRLRPAICNVWNPH